MNQPDDLEQLWKAQPVEAVISGEDMRRIVLEKTEKFDRTIRRRNARETTGALLAALYFTYVAWAQRNEMARLGALIIVGAFVWIIYYFWRHGAAPADPNPDQSIIGYQRALVSKIEHQIRLLRSVKYWNLLPLYIGLLTLSAGRMQQHAAAGAITWIDAIGPVFYTLVLAGIWWLNEVWAVRKLIDMRARVADRVHELESPC